MTITSAIMIIIGFMSVNCNSEMFW